MRQAGGYPKPAAGLLPKAVHEVTGDSYREDGASRSMPSKVIHPTLSGSLVELDPNDEIAPVHPWYVAQSGLVCRGDEFQEYESLFHEKSVLLPTSDFTSISKAVEHLNSPAAKRKGDPAEAAIKKGHCIVFSDRRREYYALFLRDHQQEVYDCFGIPPKWSSANCKWLCGKDAIGEYQDKAVVLDPEIYTSVKNAIHALAFPYDAVGEPCRLDAGFGIVFSAKMEGYFLIYQEGKKEDAYRAVGLEIAAAPTWGRQKTNTLVSWCRDFYRNRIMGSGGTTENRFQAESLVGVLSLHLTERYDVIRQLGSGAQGTAYLVKKKDSSEQYCAKESHNMTDRGIKEFTQEFERMRQIRHPHCVRVEQLLQSPQKKQLFIISEYAAGGDLYGYLSCMQKAGEKPTEEFVAGLMHQAMSGVAYLHSQGFVHNDLKPDNMLVMEEFRKDNTKTPRVVITDYGCTTHETDRRRMFGDPRYQAPESLKEMLRFLRGEIEQPHKMHNLVDIWAMGVTLFEVLTGGMIPFIYKECSSRDMKRMFTVLSDAVLSPTELEMPSLEPAVSSEAENLLKQLLAKDFKERPSAANALKHGWYEIKGHSLSTVAHEHIMFACTQDKVRQILRTAIASKLRYDHVQQCHAIFNQFDPDASGTIDESEFVQAIEKMGKDKRKAEILFERGDIDGNKHLEFSEFAAMTLDWHKLDANEMEDRLGDLIQQCDPDGAGQVELNKFKELFAGAIPDDELTAALRRMDIDSDGSISIKELKAFIQIAPAYVTGDKKDIGRPPTASFDLRI